MNDRFPDATPEELNATCIICREEMTTAKRLSCGHLFHVQCLRSWLERQHTCPICRALVAPPENGANTSGSLADAPEQGTGTAGSHSQGSAVDGVTNDTVSQHQARLKAAATAASIYERSFVYPSANTLGCIRLQPGGPATLPFQFLQSGFVPCLAPGTDMNCGERFGANPNAPDSELDAQEKHIQNQIEILQNQLQLVQNSIAETSMDTSATSSDGKGKAVASSSSCVSDYGSYGETEDMEKR
ncbi:ERAD-associated E3 ubiquitin-protein like [Actinidia chinensis var. chinensis]|uniref:ERAD-associated E3 ubiquitin-protein like n=1 Tax=Actinidia chinensis var. chinensis TaxID=1590841 RepID=A0A2R6RQF5_ACTCC|nr:ERAD-associated E3 ubiquitin-protein like [Actinidia chinensis var. chinensis]